MLANANVIANAQCERTLNKQPVQYYHDTTYICPNTCCKFLKKSVYLHEKQSVGKDAPMPSVTDLISVLICLISVLSLRLPSVRLGGTLLGRRFANRNNMADLIFVYFFSVRRNEYIMLFVQLLRCQPFCPEKVVNYETICLSVHTVSTPFVRYRFCHMNK